MPRILSISYNEALLQTRALLLSREGFEVESAVGFSAAIHACHKGKFDLVILGHSIPSEDKSAIVQQLRAVCATPILALRRPNEPPVKNANTTLILVTLTGSSVTLRKSSVRKRNRQRNPQPSSAAQITCSGRPNLAAE